MLVLNEFRHNHHPWGENFGEIYLADTLFP